MTDMTFGEKLKTWNRVLIIAMVMVMIGNTVNTLTDANKDAFLHLWENIPGLLIMMGIALVGLILGEIIPKVPVAIWITLIGILLAMPWSPTSSYVVAQVGKIGLLPAATPVLAYAGVSIGQDWVEFKKIGWKGILVALFVIIGTYLGSAVIAQLILKAQGII